MARLARYDIPDQPQHVIQRGNNRGVTFVVETDYAFYLDCLEDAAKRMGCGIHAYSLMTNHVHLLATQHELGGLSRMMQSVGRRYVRYFNLIQRRTGTLWEGRYKATLIDGPQYLLACMRYIEMNPVRAAMVAVPTDYPWSSHRVHAEGAPSSLVTPHPIYLELAAATEQRQAAYRALFLEAQDESEVSTIRDATNKAWVLGCDRFKDEIARLTERRVEPAPRGRPRKQEAHDVA
jgi:putative transposase